MPKLLANYYLSIQLLFLFFFSSAFLPKKVFAQKIRIIIPEQVDDHLNKKEIVSKETFMHYPFKDEKVDLSQFKRQNPSLELPDAIQIVLPDMTGIKDTSLLIGYLNNGTAQESYLVVLVAGNYESNEVTFFVDTNFDQDYRNDDAPTVLFGGASPKTIFLQPPKSKALKLTLSVPKRLSLVDQKLKELDAVNKKFKTKINNGLSLGISIGVGAGKLTYEYNNLAIGYPTWYNVRFTDKSINVLANYEFTKFRIGLNTTFINNYYYTAYYNVQVMEPVGIRTGVLEERNIDQHALNRLNLGLTLAYKFNLNQLSSINPFITYGKNIYLSDQYFSDTRPNKEVAYNLSPDNFIEYGVQLEFTIGNQNAFFVDIIRNHLQWEPDNFLEGIDYDNLNIKHETWKIGLGYKIGL